MQITKQINQKQTRAIGAKRGKSTHLFPSARKRVNVAKRAKPYKWLPSAEKNAAAGAKRGKTRVGQVVFGFGFLIG